jgi:hypothetical protein
LTGAAVEIGAPLQLDYISRCSPRIAISELPERCPEFWRADNLAPSFFSPAYGMLKDKFGIVWVLDVAVAYDPA